jgi:uncharacterized protein YdaL
LHLQKKNIFFETSASKQKSSDKVRVFVVYYYYVAKIYDCLFKNASDERILMDKLLTIFNSLEKFSKSSFISKNFKQRESHGLVVKADGSRSRGRGFEPRHRMLDGCKRC